MNSNKIDQKIQSFLKDNPLVKGKSNEEILSIMVDFGIITPAELKKGSAFEKTYITASDKGLVLEKSSPAKQTDAKVELTREEAQDDAVENLGVSVLSAQTLFENQKNTQGDVSRVYDMYKELTKDDLSQGKLKQAITLEKLGYTYINQAKSNTLTKKEYYEHVKEDLLMMTPGIHSMSENSIKNLKQRIDSLTIEEVKLMQKQLQNLPSEDNKEYETQAKRYLNNFKSLTEDSPELKRTGDVEIQGGQSVTETKIKPPVNYSDGDELIKFEEVFKYERGTTFSREKIAEFETAKTALQLAQSTTAKVNKIHSNLDKALANPRGDWQASDYGKVEMGLKMSLRELFGDDETVQQEGLKKLFGGKIPNNDVETSKLLLAKLDENHQKIMNGKSVADFEQEYADTYTKAFGKKNSEQLAKAYIEDNESIGARITSGMQMGGMAAMIVGGAVCLIPGAQPLGAAVLSGGGKLAMTGMAAQTAVEAINESSKTGGMTDEAQERIIKEGLVNLASFAVGAGAGIKGAQVGANLMAKGSGKFVALMAERGTDVAISMAGDMILMGDLNVEGNMIGQITATLTGLKTGKNIAKNHMNKGHLMDVPHSDLLSNPHISGKPGSSLKPKDVSFTGRKLFEADAKHNNSETGKVKLKSDEIIHLDKVSEDVSVENIKPETERVNPHNEDYTSNLVEAGTADMEAFAADKGNPYSKSSPDVIIEAAKVDGVVSKDLLDFGKILKSKKIANEYIADFINKYKNDDGTINPEIIKTFDELCGIKMPSLYLLELCTNKDGTINQKNLEGAKFLHEEKTSLYGVCSWLNVAKDAEGSFDKEIFADMRKLLEKDGVKNKITVSDAGLIFEKCMKDGVIDTDNFSLVKSLADADIPGSNINSLLYYIQDKDGSFDKSRVDKILEMKEMGIPDYSLDSDFRILFNRDRNFNEVMYRIYKELHQNSKFANEKTQILCLSKDQNGCFQESNYKFIMNLYNQVKDKKEMPRVTQALISAKNKDGVITPSYYSKSIGLLRKKLDKSSIAFVMNQCKDLSIQDKTKANDGRSFSLTLYNKIIAAIEKNQNKNQSGALATRVSLYKDKLQINTLFQDGISKIDGLSLDLDNEIFENIFSIKNNKNGENHFVVKSYDNKTGIASKSVRDNKRRETVIEETNIIKDKDGKVIRYEYLSPSDVPGIFDVRVKDALSGETKVLSSGKIDTETGFTLVEKDLTSLDGTNTKYRYEDDPSGNRIIDYKITDKDGKVLMNDSQTFEVLSDNKFVSSYNDNVYDISFDADNLTVKSRTTGESAEFKFDEFINPASDRTMLLNLLKQMPGHELIKMRENVKTLTGLQDKMQSLYNSINKELKTGDDLSVALHEAGHGKHGLATGKSEFIVNNEILQNYKAEAEAFKKNFPDLHQEHLAYFIDPKQHEAKPWKSLGMIMETIAESNALLNTYYHSPELRVRAHYLQQYFPKTIAAISNTMKNSSDFLIKAVDVQKPAVMVEAAVHGITGEAIEASLKTPELRQRGFTDDRIKDMAEFVKDDPNKIAVLKKLIPLEHQQFGYVAIREFLQSNSDVPAEILDKFLTLDNATREVRGGDLSVYEIDGILRSLKNNDGSMIDNYKETADFAYKLLSRKSDEGAMCASTIQEVIYKYGIDEKAASDVFELMSVKGMGRNQISSKDAVQLYEYAKDKNISIKEIRDVLMLTPEQLKNRGSNPLNAIDVKSILDYAPDKADIVKDLASLPTRNRLRQENSSTVAAIIQQCGDDANKISDLKRLLMLERPLNEFSQEARHFDILFANMISRDAFEGKIETIEKLFMLKPKQREKWLALDYLTDNKTVKNSKIIFDLVGENYKNLSPEDIKLFTKPENIDNIVSILKANPKLTTEGIQAELKNINVKKFTPLVKDERLMKAANYIYWDYNNNKNHPDWELLEDLQFKFENVNDKHVQEYLKNTFAEIDNISKVPVTSDSRLTVNGKLEEMSKVLDVYHTLAGHYNYIGIKGGLKKDLPTTREFIDLVKSENPDAAQEFSKYATQQYGRPEKLTFENISEEMGKDFMRDLGVERLKEFAKIKPDSPLATHFYEQYLLAFDSETSKRCADINKKYNTKIILSALHDDYKVELDFVEAELKRWHDASEGKAVMPPVLDFSKAKEKWFGSLRYGNGGTPIGYSEMSTNKAISVSGMHVDMIEDVLRHEMTHSNTKLNVLIDNSKYDLRSIMPSKVVDNNGKKTHEPDFENCKYREEFLKAGVPSSHIPYGYNDIFEFMSVASEGDMSKYSPEFKQMLVDFGMPEWELKMECVQKGNIKRAQLMSEISEKYPELKTYDELRIMQGIFEMNEMLPEHKKWKNDEIIQAHKKFMNAIAEGSNCEGIIFSSREYLADHLRPLLSHSGDTKILTEENSAFIKEKCQKLHEKGIDACDYLVKSLFDAGLGDEKSMSYRVKGEHSLFDKIKNYLFDNIDKEKCYFDAELEIRDLFAARTVVSSGEFAKHPDVVKLLQAGDKKGAQLRAAELQSQPMVDKLKALIDKQSKGESDIEISRISNYKGADGIPYLSEAQLADIKQFALSRGIQLDYVTRIEADDPMFSQIDAKAHNKKAATKVRDSGYTALQLNFKNKADGQIFEWQFRGDKVTVFAEAEHVPYDLRTGKNITSAHPELEPLYAPIQELLSKEAMTEAQFNKYNEYLTAHYEHLRKLELGFESTEPRLEDYGNFDKRLHARSLEYLHDAAEKIKANKDTPDAEIIKEYTRLVNS